MKKYNLYRIDKNGEPKKKQTFHALTIESAWAGSRCWYSNGIYLITSVDGSEAQIFTLNRE